VRDRIAMQNTYLYAIIQESLGFFFHKRRTSPRARFDANGCALTRVRTAAMSSGRTKDDDGDATAFVSQTAVMETAVRLQAEERDVREGILMLKQRKELAIATHVDAERERAEYGKRRPIFQGCALYLRRDTRGERAVVTPSFAVTDSSPHLQNAHWAKPRVTVTSC
jgi:hypothetical protein